MNRIYLNPEITGATKKKPDPGHIDLPEKTSSVDFLKTNPRELGPCITQYTKKYDFFFTPFKFNVGVDKKARGVK